MESLYPARESALFAVDLLRRNPDGLANRLLAGSLSTCREHLEPADESDDYVRQARDSAFAYGVNRTLDDLFASDSLQDTLTRDQLSCYVLGTAKDAWEFVLSIDAPGDRSAVADAIASIWAGSAISPAERLTLHLPMLPMLRCMEDQQWLDFGRFGEPMGVLLRVIERMTAATFEHLDIADQASSEQWGEDIRVATDVAEQSGRLPQITFAQCAAVGAIGAAANRCGVSPAPLVMSAISLAGAVQAIMTSDILEPEISKRLTSHWSALSL